MRHAHIFTKKEIVERMTAPLRSSCSKKHNDFVDRFVVRIAKKSDIHIIKEFRKTTGLKLCLFAPEKFYIRYE